MLFLIEYDRSSGRIVQLRTFDADQCAAAQDARLEVELKLHRQQIEREVVLLDAESEDALRRTHRRYFENLEELTAPVPAEPRVS